MKKQTAGRDALKDFAPKFAQLNDDVLFGEVWSREEKLPLRDRSLVTITALISMGLFDSSFEHHLQLAKQNRITKTEISEILTHLAFYAGWPKAWAAFRVAKNIWNDEAQAEQSPKETHQNKIMFPIGEPNSAFAQYFIGESYLSPVSTSQIGIFNVTFEPRCRNNWHIHKAENGGGQILICVGGNGLYQEWGKPVMRLKDGDVVNIPANVKHWHGACANGWFSHLAMEVAGSETSTQWLEAVDDEYYDSLNK